MNKILNKWTGAYDNAKRMQQSGWSENDVLAKAHELYSSGKRGHFSLMSECSLSVINHIMVVR
jgi:hypothetical protein